MIDALGHFSIDHMFLPHMSKGPKGNHFSIDIDDCPCEECESRRGNVVLPFSTIEITIVVNGKQVTQRLTPEEAGKLADKLKEFSEFVEALNQDISKEEDAMGEYA